MNSQIKEVSAKEILDSRGNPTVQVKITLEDNSAGFCSCPSGASTGKYEAVEIRDNDPARYNGKGVLKALSNITEIIAKEIVGKDSSNQGEIDKLLINLDGTKDKSKLGTNSILPVSIAICRAAAESQDRKFYNYINSILMKDTEAQDRVSITIPLPIFNILNGGAHADNNISFQEFIIIPKGINDYKEQLQAGVEIDYQLKQLLIARGATTGIGDEGGFAPSLPNDEVAIELILEAIDKAGYRSGEQIFLGIDVAASQYFEADDNVYAIPNIFENKPLVDKAEKLADFYKEFMKKYPIYYLEDPFSEDDFNGWTSLAYQIDPKENLLVGDDLIVTNLERLDMAIKSKAVNTVVIKPNQIGTLSEVFDVIKKCKENNIKTVFSHRSGETNDPFIVDLAVGASGDLLKIGAPVRGERVAKYNRLLEIYDQINIQSY